MREWMTVIDAAIQGVPEQAQRRRSTITNYFGLRRKKEAHRRDMDRPVSMDECSYSESREEMGLNLVSPLSPPPGGGSLGGAVRTVDYQ